MKVILLLFIFVTLFLTSNYLSKIYIEQKKQTDVLFDNVLNKLDIIIELAKLRRDKK